MKAQLTPPLEWREQEALLTWATLHQSHEPRLALLYAIPNGELRGKQTAAKLRKMGVKPGVPDLFLPVPVLHLQDHKTSWEGWSGLYIEIKRLGQESTCSYAQLWWIRALQGQGYYVSVCAGWVEAAACLCWYLQRPELAPLA